jgi:hypothetical protein
MCTLYYLGDGNIVASDEDENGNLKGINIFIIYS